MLWKLQRALKIIRHRIPKYYFLAIVLGFVNGVPRLNTEFPESIPPVSRLEVAQDIENQI